MVPTLLEHLFGQSWTAGSLLNNSTFLPLATVLLPFYGGAITAAAIGLVGRHLLGVEFFKSVMLTVIALILYYLAHLAAFGMLTSY